MDSGAARSKWAANTAAPPDRRRAANSSQMWVRRAPISTRCPPAANRAAVAKPTGEEASVTTTVLDSLTTGAGQSRSAQLNSGGRLPRAGPENPGPGNMAVTRKQRDTSGLFCKVWFMEQTPTLEGDASTQQRILAATAEVLGRNGKRKLSLSDVAVQAGVSRPTLYRWFASKEDLLSAFSKYERQTFESGMGRATAGLKGTDKLDAALRFIVEYQHSHTGGGVVALEI